MLASFPTAFLTAFIPIFVAMDAVGVLPLYLALTEGRSRSETRHILVQAVTTAGVIGVIFIFLGKAIFDFLGITVADFKVAGGLILLVIAINDLLFAGKKRRSPYAEVGVVPLGMPLIVGPAVLTALIIKVDVTGLAPTLVAFAVNLALAYVVFRFSHKIVHILGRSGTQGVSKVANLLLAAIGVMYIRMGLMEVMGLG